MPNKQHDNYWEPIDENHPEWIAVPDDLKPIFRILRERTHDLKTICGALTAQGEVASRQMKEQKETMQTLAAKVQQLTDPTEFARLLADAMHKRHVSYWNWLTKGLAVLGTVLITAAAIKSLVFG
jgi:hypothetical protein